VFAKLYGKKGELNALLLLQPKDFSKEELNS